MAYTPTAHVCGPHWTHEEMESWLYKVWLARQDKQKSSSLSEPANLPLGDSDELR